MVALALSNVQKISKETPWAYQKLRPAHLASVRSCTKLVNTLAVNEKGEIYKQFNEEKAGEHEAAMEKHRLQAAKREKELHGLVKASDERAAKMIRDQGIRFERETNAEKYNNAVQMKQYELRAHQAMERVTQQFQK